MASIGIPKGITSFMAPIMRYERHLAAVGMVAGFGIDNLTFGRIDRPGAHLIFGSYLVVAAITIVVTHALQTRADAKAERIALAAAAPIPSMPQSMSADSKPDAMAAATPPAPAAPREMGHAAHANGGERWRKYLPAITQFALGGLWSGFLVFYWRSAALAASWLFLATLLAFLVGNEVFRKYHSRLVFASLLLFFAAYSYAVFTMPLLTRSIGKLTFMTSGIAAVFLYLVFLRVLARYGWKRFAQSRWRLLGGALGITAAMNLFYFTGILPPLPLALSKIGVYHTVKRDGKVYDAQAEPEPWYTAYGIGTPIVHVAAGQPLALYSAVFAPIKLATRITHRWEWFDPKLARWTDQSRVSFAISGGRDGGYRAYTIKSNPRPGQWRVDIDTIDGRLIGRLRFDVAQAPAAVATQAVTLN